MNQLLYCACVASCSSRSLLLSFHLIFQRPSRCHRLLAISSHPLAACLLSLSVQGLRLEPSPLPRKVAARRLRKTRHKGPQVHNDPSVRPKNDLACSPFLCARLVHRENHSTPMTVTSPSFLISLPPAAMSLFVVIQELPPRICIRLICHC